MCYPDWSPYPWCQNETFKIIYLKCRLREQMSIFLRLMLVIRPYRLTATSLSDYPLYRYQQRLASLHFLLADKEPLPFCLLFLSDIPEYVFWKPYLESSLYLKLIIKIIATFMRGHYLRAARSFRLFFFDIVRTK